MNFSFFPALFDRPEKIRFAYQEEDEVIELLLRAHWVTNIPWILITFLLLFVPFLIAPLDSFLAFNFLAQIPADIKILATILWYMLVISYVIEQFLYWYFNIYIVTNINLVDVNFHSILNRDITESRLEDVQSSSTDIKGVIRSLFNFGDVNIETAAERQRIQFKNVPKPDLVKDRIQDLQHLQEELNKKGGSDVT